MLPFAGGANKYTGTFADWEDMGDGSYCFSAVELFIGEYVQLGNYCVEIKDKVAVYNSETSSYVQKYIFNNPHRVSEAELNQRELLYDGSTLNKRVLYGSRILEFPHMENHPEGIVCRNYNFYCLGQNIEPKARRFSVRSSRNKQEQIKLSWRELL